MTSKEMVATQSQREAEMLAEDLRKDRTADTATCDGKVVAAAKKHIIKKGYSHVSRINGRPRVVQICHVQSLLWIGICQI